MMGFWFLFFTHVLKAFWFRFYVNHSTFVNHLFLVSVTIKWFQVFTEDICEYKEYHFAISAFYSTITSLSFSFVEWPWNGYKWERWRSIKMNEYLFIRWSKPFALSTYFFASAIMGPLRNSNGPSHSMPDKYPFVTSTQRHAGFSLAGVIST